VIQERLIEWDKRLQDTSASLYQYPFWNEPYRRLFFKPKYISYWFDNKEVAFVSILIMEFLGVRIGLIRFGLVCMEEGKSISREAWCELEIWAKRHGYIFLRVTNTNEQVQRCVPPISGRIGRIDSADACQRQPNDL
jgi:hypothetical protein